MLGFLVVKINLPLPSLINDTLICIVPIVPEHFESWNQMRDFPINLPQDFVPEHRDNVIAAIRQPFPFHQPNRMLRGKDCSPDLVRSFVTLVNSFLSCTVRGWWVRS